MSIYFSLPNQTLVLGRDPAITDPTCHTKGTWTLDYGSRMFTFAPEPGDESYG